MIDRALECKNAYCSVLLEDDQDLTEFILEEVEWRRLGSLREILQHFDNLTTKVCASKSYVTITMTVIVYNSLMAKIEKFIEVYKDRLPDICRGAKAAYNKLSKYYARTDDSPIYSVATAVHPAMRFKYWSDQQWGQKYEKHARKTVRDMWTSQYAAKVNQDAGQTHSEAIEESDDIELVLLGFTNKASSSDELEEFVLGPIVRETPLVYWRKNFESYPQLAKMAKDFLAIPATSAPSERCFSKARSLLPYTRNRLSPEKIEEQMLLDSWYEYFSKK